MMLSFIFAFIAEYSLLSILSSDKRMYRSFLSLAFSSVSDKIARSSSSGSVMAGLIH